MTKCATGWRSTYAGRSLDRGRAFFGLAVLVAVAAYTPGSGAAGAGSRPAWSIGTHKQLFVDGAWIEAGENVVLTMNPPQQTGERLVAADQPWEKGAWIHCYNSIVKEEGPDGPRIRLWYDLILDKPPGYPGDRRAVAYAESRDGIRFRKPILGLVDKDGSKENNLVMPTDLSRLAVAGSSVMRDENPRCAPGERYKSWAKLYPKRRQAAPGHGRAGFPVEEQGGNRVWYSPDGLRWTLYPPPTGLRGSDTQPSWFWDTRIGRYLGYSREWVELTPGKTARMVGYNESDDMLHWDSFAVAIRADESDATVPLDWVSGSGRVISEREAARIADRPGANREGDPAYFAAAMDVYGTGVFKYAEAEDVYFALVPAFYHWRMRDGNPWPDTFDVQLAVSRDGKQFQRLGGRRPFIRLGPEGSFYSRWVWAFPQPIRMGDEMWLYYHGQNSDHSHRIDPRAQAHQDGITRAILRLDGFVSADVPPSGGWLVTPPLVFDGVRLELNLDTSAGGVARVEIQDASGRPIPGYTLAEADELNGNSVRMPVSWRGSRDVGPLAGRPVKLHFRLRDCKLYAFQFRSSSCRPRDPPSDAVTTPSVLGRSGCAWACGRTRRLRAVGSCV
jgi:hypothetical protein